MSYTNTGGLSAQSQYSSDGLYRSAYAGANLGLDNAYHHGANDQKAPNNWLCSAGGFGGGAPAMSSMPYQNMASSAGAMAMDRNFAAGPLINLAHTRLLTTTWRHRSHLRLPTCTQCCRRWRRQWAQHRWASSGLVPALFNHHLTDVCQSNIRNSSCSMDTIWTSRHGTRGPLLDHRGDLLCL